MTISQWLDATDRNMPARSLWQRQTRSMKGESEALWLSKPMNMMRFRKTADTQCMDGAAQSTCQYGQLSLRPLAHRPHHPLDSEVRWL
jgi:hypothetical protein